MKARKARVFRCINDFMKAFFPRTWQEQQEAAMTPYERGKAIAREALPRSKGK